MPLAPRGDRRVHYEDLPAEGTVAGLPVLLVPGTGSGARQFGTLPRRFARRGFRCLTTSPVGMPPSSTLPGAFDLDEAARDLAATLDAAGVERAIPVGTSLGGKIALCACHLLPDRFPRLVMLSSTARVTERGRRIHRFFAVIAERLPPDAIGDAIAPFLFGSTFIEERPKVVDDIVRAVRPGEQARGLMAAQARAQSDFDGEGRARALRCPALVVAGTEDTLTPPADVRATADLIDGAQYLEIEDAGHSLLLESARVFDEVAAFCTAATP
ncbi:MAG: alpha/beta fold hydrolase [Planctomycetota bacterium]